MSAMSESCCHEPVQIKPQNSKALLAVLLLSAAWVSAFFIPGGDAFRRVLEHDLRLMALPIMAGLLVGGVLDAYIPSSWIMSFLSGKRKRHLFYSVGLGFLMSSCSHGLAAIAMQLYKKGAAKSSVISFLLASPWANLSITILLFGFFKMGALIIIISAILIALLTGLIFQIIEKTGRLGVSPWKNESTPVSFFDWRHEIAGRKAVEHPRRILKGAGSLAEMVLPWMALGIFLAAVSVAAIPQDWFKNYLGPDIRGLFMTLGLATVIEVCSEGMSFLAFQLYQQTGAMGNAFVFLMAGVVTDLTEISLVWKNMGWRSALLMVVVTLPQVMLIGYGINLWMS